MKILIIQTAFLGDVVLATAVAEKLHQRYPGAQLDFMLRKGNESLLEGHPFLHKVWVWDKKNKLSNGWKLLKSLRNERYDWVVNCHRFLSSGLFALLSGAGASAGFDKNPLSVFFTKKIPHTFGTDDAPVHEVDRLQALIEHLTDAVPARPRLYPSKVQYNKVGELTANKKPYVCIAPSSVWFTKRFPAEKWIELIRKIPPDIAVFLLGSPSEHGTCGEILQKSGHTNGHNLAGQFTLLESAALMQGALMNYVNDSAPLHLCSATNAPVTAIFCSTVKSFGFTPLSDISLVLETHKNLECRPCGLHGYQACPKGHFECATSIEITDSIVPQRS